MDSGTSDPYDLNRFVSMQNYQGTYARALTELQAKQKQTHWMWFVFPQISGLGTSVMAQKFAIGSLAEAASYLAHDVLGPRLLECTAVVLATSDRSAIEILGEIDAKKLHSSMTLFQHASTDKSVFERVIQKYFDGLEDVGTISILGVS